MAYKITLGGKLRSLRSGRELEEVETVRWRDGFLEPATAGRRRSAPARAGKNAVAMALSILTGAVCLGALGAMSFNVVNGAWVTRGSMDSRLRHEIFPSVAARRGFMEPLQAENAQREMRGQPPLLQPWDRHVLAAQQRPYLIRLQQQLDALQHVTGPGIR